MRRILIVEDHPDLASCLEVFMHLKGWDVQVVNSAEKALIVPPPDVVVLDYHLPGINGLKLLEAIKVDSRWSKTGVVFVTGADATTSSELVMKVASMGVTFLHKPFTMDAFLAVLEAAVGKDSK